MWETKFSFSVIFILFYFCILIKTVETFLSSFWKNLCLLFPRHSSRPILLFWQLWKWQFLMFAPKVPIFLILIFHVLPSSACCPTLQLFPLLYWIIASLLLIFASRLRSSLKFVTLFSFFSSNTWNQSFQIPSSFFYQHVIFYLHYSPLSISFNINFQITF